jgi:hypothetical protein
MSSPAYDYPQIGIKKSVWPPEIFKLDWATVTITVTGDSRKQVAPVPTAVVLALDYSGSMAADSAYQEVSAAAKDVVSMLTPGVDRVAIITIRDKATVDVPLTSNLAGIDQIIDGFEPDGKTNLQEAFDKANNELMADKSPNKIVILMSDGWPTTGPNAGQAQVTYLMNHCPVPVSYGIKYFAIAWGPAPNMPLLYLLATKTGGTYQEAPTKAELKAAFKAAYQQGAYWLHTTMVDVTEKVSKSLKIKPGSLNWSFPSSLEDQAKFKADVQAAEKVFYATNKLAVPRIHLLGKNEVFTLYFDVTSTTCTKQQIVIDVDDAASQVAYEAGKAAPVVDPMPQAQLKVRPCAVILTKDLDEATHTVTLRVRNGLNREIADVDVHEELTGFFAAAPPIKPQPDELSPDSRRIRWRAGTMAPDAEHAFTFQIVGTAVSSGQPGSYELDAEGAVVAYATDVLQFEVLATQPEFQSFDHDLKSHALSQATCAFLTTKNFHTEPGTAVQETPGAPEFGWIIDPGGWAFKVKATALGYEVYDFTLCRERFPQKTTSPNYVPQ